MSVFTRPKRPKKGQQKHWHYSFRLRGARYRGALPEARTKWEAEQAETKIRQQIFEGKFGVALREAPRFSAYLTETYLPHSKAHKQTHRDDIWRGKVLNRYFGSLRLDEITPFAIERFKRERREGQTIRGQQRSPQSVNLELTLLSTVLQMAADHGLILTNPCRKVKRLKVDNQRERYLTDEEEKRLMAWLSEHRPYLKAIVLTALHTGMRRGEILSLRWAEVDLERNVIHVTKTKTKRNRAIPVNSLLRAVLLQQQRVTGRDEHVFEIRDCKRSFTHACTKVKINDFRFHDLRHTAATRMGDLGATQFELQQIFGWTNPQMAARYTHATGDGMRRAMELLARPREQAGHKTATKQTRLLQAAAANK